MATSIKLCAQNSAICLLCAKEFGQNLRNAGRRKILNASGQPHPEFTCLCEVLQVDIATDCLTQSYLCRQCFDSLAKLQSYKIKVKDIIVDLKSKATNGPLTKCKRTRVHTPVKLNVLVT